MPNRIKYTDEQLIELAKSFEYRRDFYTENPSAYAAVKRRGLDEVALSHMKRAPSRARKYTDDDIISLAKQFKTSALFTRKHENLRTLARRRGILPRLNAVWETQES